MAGRVHCKSDSKWHFKGLNVGLMVSKRSAGGDVAAHDHHSCCEAAMETYKEYKVRMTADMGVIIKARHPSDAERIFLDILVDQLVKRKILDVFNPTSIKATEISAEEKNGNKI